VKRGNRKRPYAQLGRALAEWRKSYRWTQPFAAKQVGVSAYYLAKTELGYYSPQFKTLQKFARAYGCSLSALLQGVET
jgi:transcriptional regulator with XRE-family HTH domain